MAGPEKKGDPSVVNADLIAEANTLARNRTDQNTQSLIARGRAIIPLSRLQSIHRRLQRLSR